MDRATARELIEQKSQEILPVLDRLENALRIEIAREQEIIDKYYRELVQKEKISNFITIFIAILYPAVLLLLVTILWAILQPV